MSDFDLMSAQARDMANANPPHIVLPKFGVLLENAFLSLFALLGWLIGRVWFHAARLLFVVGLAFADGYKQGAHVPEKPPVQQVAPPTGPPITDMTQVGPAAFAWSERG